MQFAVNVLVGYFQLWVSVFTTVGAALAYLYSNYIDPIFQLIGAILTQIVGPAFAALWTDYIQPVFGWIGGLIST